MLPRVVETRALPSFRLWLRFADGSEGTVDVSDMVGKGVFAAWNDPAVWNAVSVDPEARTVSWPGGLDLCPDVLYSEVTGRALPAAPSSRRAAS